MKTLKINLPILALAFLCCCRVWAQDTAGQHPQHSFFELSNYKLESGTVLPKASILYVTHGELNADGSNAILLQSAYGGDHHGYDFLIGPDKALNPNKYFIVSTELMGGSGSSSPSNTPPPFDGPRFPDVTIRDNVQASYRLLQEEFEIKHLKAVIGFSMGGQQAFQWAVSYPDFMDIIVPICGTAKTYHHGAVRLESVNNIIKADANFNNGDFESLSTKTREAWVSHWVAWVFSQQWWRQEKFKPQFETPQDVIDAWTQGSTDWQPNDLLMLARTWQMHDIGDTPGFDGDVEKALKSIKARVLYMPGETDLYFPIENARYESQYIANVTFLPIPSLGGHTAGGGQNAEDNAFLNAQIKKILSEQ